MTLWFHIRHGSPSLISESNIQYLVNTKLLAKNLYKDKINNIK